VRRSLGLERVEGIRLSLARALGYRPDRAPQPNDFGFIETRIVRRLLSLKTSKLEQTLTAVCAHATGLLVSNFVGGDESVKRKIVASRHTLA
jgi:hypothetical protein